jgi:hypothetical protein
MNTMANASEMGLEFEQGLQEFEYEGEWEHHELSHEMEGDQFFGRIARGIGRFVKRAAPLLKNIARVAAPMVGTAIGGPFGAILGKVATSALGEEEFEHHEASYELEDESSHEWEHHEMEHPESLHEWESELEGAALSHEWEQHEFENPESAHEWEHHEMSHEAAHEISHHEVAVHEALAEVMAEAATHEQHEAQAEAMIGAAVVTVLSPRDRRALRQLLPHLVRGAAVLTRVLRKRQATRPAVRAVPTIMRRTVATLKKQARAGKPVSRRAAARAAATEVKRVLSNPAACAAAIRQNVRTVKRMRANGRTCA